MEQSTYYTLVGGSTVAGLLGSIIRWVVVPAYQFFYGMAQNIRDLQTTVNLMMNNHLHDLRVRLEKIEGQLDGQDSTCNTGRDQADREG